MESDLKYYECTASDRFINSVGVKSALILRGSRKIFGNADNAEKYLASLVNENYDFPMNIKTANPLVKRLGGKTQCLVLGNPSVEKVVIYFHGGAFVRHITHNHIKMLDELCTRSGYCFIIPLYLTAPKYTWKDSYKDILTIYTRVLDKFDSKNVVFMGDSAGGAVALTVQTFLRENNIALPDKLILISPVTELSCENRDMIKFADKDPMFGGTLGLKKCFDAWRSDTPVESPYINPMYLNFENFPETHIFIGDSDMLYFDCMKFFNKAKAHGADVKLRVYEKMYHVFPLYPLSASKNAISEIVKLLK